MDLLALPGADEEAVPPLPPVATSQTGDVWLLGQHRVICGDATSAETVEQITTAAGKKDGMGSLVCRRRPVSHTLRVGQRFWLTAT